MWNRETSKPTVPSAPPLAAAQEPAPQPEPVAAAPVVIGPPAAPAKARGSSLVIKGELTGAEVIARVVILHGSMTGNITAFERVELKATGRMNGDLVSPKVQMSDGATYTGRLETRNPGKQQASGKTHNKPELVAV